jgi:hypothetical protein
MLRIFGGDPYEQTGGRTDTVSLLFVEFIHSVEGTHNRMTTIKVTPFLCDYVNTNSERYRHGIMTITMGSAECCLD